MPSRVDVIGTEHADDGAQNSDPWLMRGGNPEDGEESVRRTEAAKRMAPKLWARQAPRKLVQFLGRNVSRCAALPAPDERRNRRARRELKQSSSILPDLLHEIAGGYRPGHRG
jgi:hypothetical protein